MDDGRHLPGRHTVERVNVDDARRITAIEDLHAPRDGGLPAVKFLVEVVAQTADRLRQHDARGDGVTESRQRNPSAAASNPRSDTTEGDGTPDAQAALPDPQRGTKSGATLAEVCFPVGEDVIETPADQSERHRPQRNVVDDAALAATRRPATVADD